MPRSLPIIAIISYLVITSFTVNAQSLAPCFERPNYLDNPWINAEAFCLEHVIDDPNSGELGFTALAIAPDGTLYATRPLAGELLAIEDTDEDDLPDTGRVVAEGLTLPNG